MTNLGNILWNAARRQASQPAIFDGPWIYDFAQVAIATGRETKRIKTLIPAPGTSVALLIPNCPAFSVGYFAALWADAVVVPVNPLLSDQEVTSILNDCEASLLIVEASLSERGVTIQHSLPNLKVIEMPADPIRSPGSIPIDAGWEPEPQADFDETAVVLYTSGSTGRPKGVELTHRNLLTNAESVSQEKFSTKQVTHILGPGHVALAALPLSHAFGQTNLQNGMWYSGGAICYQRKFEPNSALRKIADNRVTFFAGVPTMYTELLKARSNSKEPLSSLQFCVCGGAALDATLKQDFLREFNVPIQESYGLTETSPMISCQAIDQTQKNGCVGKPIAGVKVRIVDQDSSVLDNSGRGELQVSGPNVFRGYRKQPDATRAVLRDGWFSTGDIARIDEDGEIWIVGRKKEVINRGGYNVYPREVETVIAQLAWVSEVAVVGVPNERIGEEIKAFVVPATEFYDSSEHSKVPSAREFEATERLGEQVVEHCKMNLTPYKCPRIVKIMVRLPKGSTGKIDKKKLRDL